MNLIVSYSFSKLHKYYRCSQSELCFESIQQGLLLWQYKMQRLDDSLGKFQLERLKTVNAYHKNADILSV